ncbi:MAG: hypothetical protein WHS64_03975 [Fervidobacterium sp.]|uniref:hypothetical protein n=1 Tax=Fervidobacterium TaxID=2422 RepID=UPI00220A183C|nr:hypothetical protein IB67_02105 [Fervidobacterium riparium]
MRELSILFRYVGLNLMQQNAQRKSKRKESNTSRSQGSRYIILLLFSTLPMAIFIYLSNYQIYKALSAFPDVAKAFYFLTISMFSLFYVVGFVGTGMYAFSRNEDVEFLLTLPIRRNVITLYYLLVTLSSQAFTLGFFVASALAYGIAVKQNVLAFILQTLLHLIFLSSVSALFAVLFGGVTSKRYLRILNTVMILLLVFIYLVFVSLQDVDFSTLGENQNIVKLLSFANSKYNVLTWSYSENVSIVLAVGILSVGSLFLFWKLAGKVGFENIRKKSKEKKEYFKKSSYSSRMGGVLWKDTKLLVRNEQFIFLILYPAIFSLFMFFTSSSSISALTPYIVIAVLYCAIEAGILTSNEIQYKSVVKAFPIRPKNLILPKLIIPVFINISVFVAITIIASIIRKFSVQSLIYVAISVLLFMLSALIGSYYSIKSPGKAKNQPFSVGATFLIEGITLGLAFGIIFPLNLIIMRAKLEGIKMVLNWLLLTGSGIALAVLFAVYYKKLKNILLSEE